MDEEFWESIKCSMEEMQKGLEELEWHMYLPLLSEKLSIGDPRSGILLALSWLLSDLFDNNWGGVR